MSYDAWRLVLHMCMLGDVGHSTGLTLHTHTLVCVCVRCSWRHKHIWVTSAVGCRTGQVCLLYMLANAYLLPALLCGLDRHGIPEAVGDIQHRNNGALLVQHLYCACSDTVSGQCHTHLLGNDLVASLTGFRDRSFAEYYTSV